VTSALVGGLPFTVDTVTSPAAAWLVVNPTTGGTATGAATTFTVTPAAGCGGFAVNTTTTTTVHLKNLPGPDKLISVTLTVTALTSSLVPSASAVTVLCGKTNPGGLYQPGAVQSVYVTSAAAGGTAFTVDNVTSPPAAWLSVTPLAGGTAGTSPVKLSIVPAAGCGGFAVNTSNTTTI